MIHYIIAWSNQNNTRKSKKLSFNNQQHFDRWYDKWLSFGNTIIGVYPCDENGILLDKQTT